VPKKKRATKATQRSTPTPKRGDDRFEPIRSIRVRGAREHNLKGVDVDIPRDRLVVITGLSGSGKSSLAFDTVFAEGQRKYMESLSAYARQFLDQLKKPDVESIEGLPPTIAIEQRSAAHNPRSTVATSTEIYDYLRLLFARAGEPVCWEPTKLGRAASVIERCNTPIDRTEPSQISRSVATLPEKTKMMILAPVVRGKKGYHKDVLEQLQQEGFVRARVDGRVVDLTRELDPEADTDNPLALGRYEKHDIEAVVDRIAVKPDARKRISESVETALAKGGGTVVVSVQGQDGTWSDKVYSENLACPVHPECALEDLEPRLFSFNSHRGACPTCQGLGAVLEFDAELMMPDPDKPIGRGGIAPLKRNGPAGMFAGRFVRHFCRQYGIDKETPVGALDEDTTHVLLHGDDAGWEGVVPMLSRWFEKTDSDWAKEFMTEFMAEQECPSCFGDRLNERASSVYLPTVVPLPEEVVAQRRRHGLSEDPHRFSIADFSRLDIHKAVELLDGLQLSREATQIAEPILREVRARLGFLSSVGLEYLSLNRKMATLSGGEAQRIRLATQVGSGIVGAAYVLDEPTIGLHARDNTRLIRTLRKLADIGNTVLIVEHDEEMIRAADHVIDVGPGPGVHGGQVIAQGSIDDIAQVEASLTGHYLTGRKKIPTPRPEERRALDRKRALVVKNARENNLKNVDATFPLGGLVVVTGVSGSGKSTLVNDILLSAVRRHLGLRAKPGLHDRVNGLKNVDRVIEVDQSPIGRTPRSNPATYTNMFDEIRRLFAQVPDAKMRGYKVGRFSFNVKGGRCEACQGQGTRKVAMHFLPDIFVTCEVCNGKRFNAETLEIDYRGKSIADVLDMTIEEAETFFRNHPRIHRHAKCLLDVGLGYVRLGQPSTTLSGGEAQRVKLATELAKGEGLKDPSQQGKTLYILDEPTTGLHFEDIRKLILVLDRLAAQGNSVVVIEHNLDVIKNADWLVDLGPEGGDDGGTIVAEGTPEAVATVSESHTGRYLEGLLHGPMPKKRAG
jgi:excinuclease ABC subunit A